MVGMRILDSHLHLIDPAVLRYAWLEGRLLRRFGSRELTTAVAEGPDADARAFVFVQAECDAAQSIDEVDWVAGLASDTSVRGIVARAPLEDGGRVRAHLDALQERPLVVGVRRLLQSEPEGFAAQTGFVAGARAVAAAGLVFDACVRADQLREVTALADAVPDLAIVLDHLGKPAVGSARHPLVPSGDWLRDLRELAQRPNVVAKASGLPAESTGDWSAAQLHPFLDAALDVFGAKRLLFGGDAPVSWRLGAWTSAVVEWTASLAPDEADAILWANAERVYRLAADG